MDILLSLQSVNVNRSSTTQESSNDIRKRVEKARVHQYERYQQEVSNAKVPFEILVETSALTTEQKKTLTQISSKQNWSNRVQIKIIRLARTISDLAGEERIADQAIWEAMTLRRWEQNKQMAIAREK
ncbi:hypothetical protein [Niallia sp. RD1]|uniref:magnesium chelatase subunit ChlI family protein n=1 Tax=Niallia sp. RD1 TaxID=2962858 RepID=UPI0020C19C37|nr:hypothetical protein [Niallia sp. RD1]UTI44489.1 hypothetical protein NKG37_03655 [Niallia sp. RD1]